MKTARCDGNSPEWCKHQQAEALAEEVTRVAMREVRPGGSLMAATCGVMASPALWKEAVDAVRQRMAGEA